MYLYIHRGGCAVCAGELAYNRASVRACSYARAFYIAI